VTIGSFKQSTELRHDGQRDQADDDEQVWECARSVAGEKQRLDATCPNCRRRPNDKHDDEHPCDDRFLAAMNFKEPFDLITHVRTLVKLGEGR
jgi:hypothetical protein